MLRACDRVVAMKLGVFLLISVTLHASGLVYPVVFPGAQKEGLIPVTLVVSKKESVEEPGDNGPGGSNKLTPGTPKHHATTQPGITNSNEENKEASESPMSIKAAVMPVDVPTGIEGTAVVAAAETQGGSSGQPGHGSAGEGGGSGGKGSSGGGNGSGGGVGDGIGGAKFVQAGYGYSPKPEYPDTARRDGKEGRVVLRVLVDEEGKSKLVEVSDSSGSAVLDRAATEAIRRWRFSPAHYGNKAVESWVKVPIEFRLTDKN
jgi:periplasmic protein TonB